MLEHKVAFLGSSFLYSAGSQGLLTPQALTVLEQMLYFCELFDFSSHSGMHVVSRWPELLLCGHPHSCVCLEIIMEICKETSNPLKEFEGTGFSFTNYYLEERKILNLLWNFSVAITEINENVQDFL